jgi:UDP-glucose 4-epimerase
MKDLVDKIVLVTGGAGFIGSHLVRRLVALGVREVRVVDSLETGSHANLAGCGGPVVHHSLKLGTVARAMFMPSLEGVNIVFHLAAQKHNHSLDRPDDLLRANVLGTQDLLECAALQGVDTIVFSSSLYAYGRLAGPPMREDEVPKPRTLYGISKLACEHMVHALGLRAGIRTVCLRYFFVYGPRQFAGTGYPSVIVKNFRRILAGESPLIHGDGSQVLDYVFVDDVVDATLACVTSGGQGETYNVGSGTGTAIEELVETMLKVAGSPLAKAYAPPDQTAGSRRVASIDLVRTALGWTPKTSLRDGLASVYRWMTVPRERD